MNGSYDLYPDFGPLYEATCFSLWLFNDGFQGCAAVFAKVGDGFVTRPNIFNQPRFEFAATAYAVEVAVDIKFDQYSGMAGRLTRANTRITCWKFKLLKSKVSA